MSYQLMSEDVIELADDLGFKTFILMGHSMGGKTAMWTANQFGDRLEKLILVDIAPKTYQPGHLTYFDAFEQIAWNTLSSRKEIDDALMAYESNMGVRLFLAKNIDRNSEGSFSVKSNIKAIKNAYTEIISELHFNSVFNQPTLFLLGENSRYLKEEDKAYILKYFPGSEFMNVTNAGHWVHADNPKEFLEKLIGFLRS